MYRAKPKDGLAWVTGASSGIGRAVAVELARRGFVVVATARREAELHKVVGEAMSVGGAMLVLPGDITDPAGIEALVQRIERNHGPIALAFLNAGGASSSGSQDLGAQAFRETYDLNVEGALNCLRPVLDHMKQRARGQVAVNASLAGYGGLPRGMAYGAAKAALIHICESLKFEMGRRGVTVQVVNPGFVQTPMLDGADFATPFLLPSGEAARRIVDGFEAGGFEICFPKRLAWPAKLVNILPYWLYFRVIGWATGQRRKRH